MLQALARKPARTQDQHHHRHAGKTTYQQKALAHRPTELHQLLKVLCAFLQVLAPADQHKLSLRVYTSAMRLRRCTCGSAQCKPRLHHLQSTACQLKRTASPTPAHSYWHWTEQCKRLRCTGCVAPSQHGARGMCSVGAMGPITSAGTVEKMAFAAVRAPGRRHKCAATTCVDNTRQPTHLISSTRGMRVSPMADDGVAAPMAHEVRMHTQRQRSRCLHKPVGKPTATC